MTNHVQRRAVLAGLTALTLAGCVTSNSDILLDVAATQSAIGVYSILPEEFRQIKIGTTAFANKQADFSSAKWNMNTFIEERLAEKLTKKGLPSVGIVRTQRRARPLDNFGVYVSDNQSSALGEVFAAARAVGMSQVAVVQPWYNYDSSVLPFGLRSPYGLYERAFLGRSPGPNTFLHFMIKFYDPVTSRPDQAIYFSKFGSTSVAIKEPTQFTPKELTSLEQDLKSLVETSLSSELAIS